MAKRECGACELGDDLARFQRQQVSTQTVLTLLRFGAGGGCEFVILTSLAYGRCFFRVDGKCNLPRELHVSLRSASTAYCATLLISLNYIIKTENHFRILNLNGVHHPLLSWTECRFSIE
eukprot:IDg5905t1